MTLRLRYDYVVLKKVKLYVLFMDFSKAYNSVPLLKLTDLLRTLGCGRITIRARQRVYESTKSILKAAVIHTTIGVRQGVPSSCLLFVLYVDQMVRMPRTAGVDGFLFSLHALLLMDDIVILVTSREMCELKFDIVCRFCSESHIVIDEKKKLICSQSGM